MECRSNCRVPSHVVAMLVYKFKLIFSLQMTGNQQLCGIGALRSNQDGEPWKVMMTTESQGLMGLLFSLSWMLNLRSRLIRLLKYQDWPLSFSLDKILRSSRSRSP